MQGDWPTIEEMRGRILIVLSGEEDSRKTYYNNPSPNLAVALNCGTGSSFLKALVKAFDKLHMFLAENSAYCVSSTAGGPRAASSWELPACR